MPATTALPSLLQAQDWLRLKLERGGAPREFPTSATLDASKYDSEGLLRTTLTTTRLGTRFQGQGIPLAGRDKWVGTRNPRRKQQLESEQVTPFLI